MRVQSHCVLDATNPSDNLSNIYHPEHMGRTAPKWRRIVKWWKNINCLLMRPVIGVFFFFKSITLNYEPLLIYHTWLITKSTAFLTQSKNFSSILGISEWIFCPKYRFRLKPKTRLLFSEKEWLSRCKSKSFTIQIMKWP